MTATPSTTTQDVSPLSVPVFRMLWLAGLFSSLGTWVQEVGSSWQMVAMTSSATLIAMVQTATTLPIFLLSVPGGAIADVLDRRRVLLATQTWLMAMSALLALATWSGWMTPALLLGLLFAMGVASSVNAPAWQSLVSELLPRPLVPQGVALQSVAFNVARSIGPAVGGWLVAAQGPALAFGVNAVSYLGVLYFLTRWKRAPNPGSLAPERLASAMEAGLRYARFAPEFQSVLARSVTFVFGSSCLFALLPVFVRDQLGGNAEAYGYLMGSMGIGAVSAATVLPRIRRRMSNDRLVGWVALVFSALLLLLSRATETWAACLAMFGVGSCWLSAMSTFNASVQVSVAAWVRARCISLYMLTFFGTTALGSALWGAVADQVGVVWTMTIASATGLVAGLLGRRFPLGAGESLDLSPSRHWPAPSVDARSESERLAVIVQVEYRIRDADRATFQAAMRDVRAMRRRDGATRWVLLEEAHERGRFTELMVYGTLEDYRRVEERMTVHDRNLELRAAALHDGDAPSIRVQLAGGDVLRREEPLTAPSASPGAERVAPADRPGAADNHPDEVRK